MKTFVRIVLFILLLPGSVHAAKPGNLKFSVDVRIAGLEAGDTLRFSKITLPRWTHEAGFDIIVGNDGRGKYKGRHEHTQLYVMRYHPRHGTAPDSDRGGATVLIGSGTTKITGTRDYIYYSAVENNLYDKRLRQILALEDSLGRIRGDIGKKIRVAEAEKDNAKVERLLDEFNNFSTIHRAEYDRLRRMQRDYAATSGGEYAALEIARQTYKPVEELRGLYEKLSPAGKDSYYGRFAAEIIAGMELSAPGKPAPDIELETAAGKKVRFSDFTGKYLLLYVFGLCPGSFQIDSHVAELYDKYKDRLEVIGITDSFEALASFRDDISEGTTFMGMDLRNVLGGMLAHPWANDVELKGGNSVFMDTYYATGLPYFVFISPDGTIVAKAIGDEAYMVAQKTLAASE